MVKKLDIKKIKKHVDSVNLAYDLLSSREWTPYELFNFLYVKDKNDYTVQEKKQIKNVLNPRYTPALSDHYKVGSYVKQLFEQDGYPPLQQSYMTSTDIVISREYMGKDHSFKIQVEIDSIRYEMRVYIEVITDLDYFDEYGYFVIKPSIEANDRNKNLHFKVIISNIFNLTKWEQDSNREKQREVFDKYDDLRRSYSYFNILGKWRWSNKMFQGSKEYNKEVVSLAKQTHAPFNSTLFTILRFNIFTFLFPNSSLSKLYRKGQSILAKHVADYKDCNYYCRNLPLSPYMQKLSDLPKSFEKIVTNDSKYKELFNDYVDKFYNVFNNILDRQNVYMVLDDVEIGGEKKE
ncbi:hypothetical protein [Liquorilactobacillus hordei]|uniref:hypothetical protein n=1 Tax=Liquorilactobacillus hordei TaxID=468911 RepID=UPI0039E96D41